MWNLRYSGHSHCNNCPHYKSVHLILCPLYGDPTTLYLICRSSIDKDEFVSKFGNIMVICNASNVYIWDDQICDGRKDCVDGEDEHKCNTCKLVSS